MWLHNPPTLKTTRDGNHCKPRRRSRSRRSKLKDTPFIPIVSPLILLNTDLYLGKAICHMQRHSKGMAIFTAMHHYVEMYWTAVHASYCLACPSYFFTAFYIMLIYHHVVMFKIQITMNINIENKTNILGFTPPIMYYFMQMRYTIWPLVRKAVFSKCSRTWSCVSLTRFTTSNSITIIQIWQNEGRWYCNLADWCYVLSLRN